MYLVGITEEDFVGSEVQIQSDKKQLRVHVKEAISIINNPFAAKTLKNIYKFNDDSMSDVDEEKAVAMA